MRPGIATLATNIPQTDTATEEVDFRHAIEAATPAQPAAPAAGPTSSSTTTNQFGNPSQPSTVTVNNPLFGLENLAEPQRLCELRHQRKRELIRDASVFGPAS